MSGARRTLFPAAAFAVAAGAAAGAVVAVAVVAVAADAWKGNRAVVGLVSCERVACSWRHGRGVVGDRPRPRRPSPRRRRRRRCLSSYDYRPSHVYDKSCSQAVRRLSHSLLQPGLTRCAARMHHRTIRDLTGGAISSDPHGRRSARSSPLYTGRNKSARNRLIDARFRTRCRARPTCRLDSAAR